ncbi:hypothetical protein [Corallococcus sp. EGB]|uniref:hypothetical protein n=1 Tax=Corallococcus sp. EGB TaxID=1521117 RepID=UPI001CC052C5|nr:hypothetical protein [Corallococcus sp. EGB]
MALDADVFVDSVARLARAAPVSTHLVEAAQRLLAAAYGRWCKRKSLCADCLRLLEHGPTRWPSPSRWTRWGTRRRTRALSLSLWLSPEPVSKGNAATLTAVRIVGEQYAEVMGGNAARAFVVLATAALGSTALSNSTPPCVTAAVRQTALYLGPVAITGHTATFSTSAHSQSPGSLVR